MTLFIPEFEGQVRCDILMSSRAASLMVILNYDSAARGETVASFHIWLDTDLVTVILPARPQNMLIVQMFLFVYARITIRWKFQRVWWLNSAVYYAFTSLHFGSPPN